MFCPKCGTKLPDDAQFCGGCGVPLKHAADGSVQAVGMAASQTQAMQSGSLRGTSHSLVAARKVSFAPTAICAACGLLFVACIVVLALGFAEEVKLLVSSLSMYDEKIVTMVPLGFAACLIVPCLLCLFGFENCAERIVRRCTGREKIARTVFQGILAAAFLAVFAALPLFVDLIAQIPFDRASIMALEEAIASLGRVAVIGVWIPIAAVVLLFVLQGLLPAGNERKSV